MNNIEFKVAIVSAVLIFGGYGFDLLGVDVGVLMMICGTLFGGYFKAKEGIEDTIRDKRLNVEILMIVAAIAAMLIGDYFEAGVLIVIFAVSGALENMSREKSKKAIDSLINLSPETALKLVGSEYVKCDVEMLVVGDKIKVLPGQRVAVDSVLLSEYGQFDSKAITGESSLLDLECGESLFSGYVNLNYVTELEVLRPSSQSMLQKIILLVQEAQDTKPKVQKRIEKLESIYVNSVLLVAIFVGLMLPYFLSIDSSVLQYKAIVILVVASPCAIMASIIPAMLSLISKHAKEGVLIKGGSVFEDISSLDAICFDKTGTLTKGELQIVDVISYDSFDRDDIIQIAGSIEANTVHKIGQSIFEYMNKCGIDAVKVTSFSESVGKGVTAVIGEKRYQLGNAGFVGVEGEVGYGTRVYVKCEDKVVGVIVLEDEIRADALDLISSLKKLGIASIMITGDNYATAEMISKKLGVSEFYADTLPDEKVRILDDVKLRYGTVGFVGDGVNDAPALAKSDVAIAMGLGSDVAIDTASVVLVDDDVLKIISLISGSRKLRLIVSQNLVFASVVIVMMLILNVVLVVNLPFAVVMHEGSTILVILNGLRLLKF